MGVLKDIKSLSKEYMRDPYGQYWRHLDKILALGVNQGITDGEIVEHVKDYFKDKE